MFDLQKGDSQKKQPKELLYDIEIAMKDPKKVREIKEKILNDIRKLKVLQGSNPEEFEKINRIINGYETMEKVLARVKTK